ncbi:MAG: CinA family protein [Candidatus Thermoplasmatota archaeon]
MASLEEEIGALLRKHSLKLAVAESCTGGLIANRITNISGSSDYFERGFVTYSIKAKQELLGVPLKTIEKFGVVSSQTALAMAEGARKRSKTDLGVGVTGIAGPTGGTPDKPVGLVYIALSYDKGNICKEFKFKADRIGIKERASDEALKLIKEYLEAKE